MVAKVKKPRRSLVSTVASSTVSRLSMVLLTVLAGITPAAALAQGAAEAANPFQSLLTKADALVSVKFVLKIKTEA